MGSPKASLGHNKSASNVDETPPPRLSLGGPSLAAAKTIAYAGRILKGESDLRRPAAFEALKQFCPERTGRGYRAVTASGLHLSSLESAEIHRITHSFNIGDSPEIAEFRALLHIPV